MLQDVYMQRVRNQISNTFWNNAGRSRLDAESTFSHGMNHSEFTCSAVTHSDVTEPLIVSFS